MTASRIAGSVLPGEIDHFEGILRRADHRSRQRQCDNPDNAARKRERTDELATAARLALLLWELIQALVREFFNGGGTGRIRQRTRHRRRPGNKRGVRRALPIPWGRVGRLLICAPSRLHTVSNHQRDCNV